MKVIGPDARAAKPRKWFWLVGIVPHVEVWAHEIHIGFWQQPHSGKFNPVMRKGRIRVNQFGVYFGKTVIYKRRALRELEAR